MSWWLSSKVIAVVYSSGYLIRNDFLATELCLALLWLLLPLLLLLLRVLLVLRLSRLFLMTILMIVWCTMCCWQYH
jgi:hypothetical protein